MKKKRESEIIENIEILDIASEGKVIARYNDFVIFVKNGIPGDIADIRLLRKLSNFAEGVAIRFHKLSEKRVNPFCEHFGPCGGCKWQNISYEDQLFYKQKQVMENLQHIGKLNNINLSPIIPSERTTYYRNKLEFTFCNRRWLINDDPDSNNSNGLGFYMPGMFDRVLDLKHCWLQQDPSNAIRLAVKKYGMENNLQFFDLRKGTGFLRNLIIRISSINEIMVIVSFFNNDENEIRKLLDHLSKMFPEITALMYFINPKSNDSYSDLEIISYLGKGHIFEKMGDLKFKISPKSFYQTNSFQALNLYKVALDFACLTGQETVYDLYTGTGTIANFIARLCKKVIGIDCIPEAINDARYNSSINGISNTSFFDSDVIDILDETFVETNGKPDVVILDPPRAGLHPNMVKIIRRIKPQKIVYISCNPPTQSRDINLMNDLYSVTKIQPVDMFPHTFHVENVVLMELIQS